MSRNSNEFNNGKLRLLNDGEKTALLQVFSKIEFVKNLYYSDDRRKVYVMLTVLDVNSVYGEVIRDIYDLTIKPRLGLPSDITIWIVNPNYEMMDVEWIGKGGSHD